MTLAAASIGCYASHPLADRAEGDGGLDGGDARSSDVTDAPVDAPVCPIEVDAGRYFLYHGYCFLHTAWCCSDDDCERSCLENNRCQGWDTCMCSDDAACSPGASCVTNEVPCGGCVRPKPRCSVSTDCVPPDTCEGGFCTDLTDCFGGGR